MAAYAPVSASFSSLSLTSRRHHHHHHLLRRHCLPFAASKPPQSVSKPPNLTHLKATSSFEDAPIESEEEIARAYEEICGPAYSGESYLGKNIYAMDSKMAKKTTSLGMKNKVKKVRDGLQEIVMEIREVSRASTGGGRRSFRVITVVGDRNGNVGVGMGKAKIKEIAVKKAATDARRNMIAVPMTKFQTFPHRSEADYGAATVMLRPAAPGTGVIAGGAVRVVLELAGIKNALGKQLGSNNVLNNARATLVAVQKMKQFREVAEDRGIPMEEMWK